MASKYYPLRQFQNRSDVREAFKGLQEKYPNLNPRDSEAIAMPAVMKRLQTGGVNFMSPGAPIAVLSQEVQGVLAFGQWALSGKRILHFTPELTQAFIHSDCGDMRIDDVTPEYPAQYFRFDMPEDEPILYSDNNVAFEGAYVLYTPNISMRVVLVGKAIEPLPVDQAWKERYDLRIKADHFGKPAQEAIDSALADDLADLRNTANQIKAKGTTMGLADVDLLYERMQKDHEAYRLALRLVLNASAFLKIEAEDKKTRWPDEAPQKMVAQAESGSQKESERAKSKLWSLGYVPIFHIGEEFGRKYRSPSAGMRAHWRKGHYRRQAFGPQLSQRKLIWIFPMLVASGEDVPVPDSVQKLPDAGMP